MAVGDTAVVAVKVNADGAVLNTIDGEVALTASGGNLTVSEFSLANSSFGLWPRTPSLSKDGRTISFVGGVPGGFSIEGATVFKFVVEATKEGTITIAPRNLSVFANDGKGTKLPVTLKNIAITVTAKGDGAPAQNDWSGIVSADVKAPEDFIIVFGQDATLFGGKTFAFFSAVDNQSGIDHYDVSENGAPAVRSGSTYVLQDQSGNAKITVVAYDKAGNKKSASSSVQPATSGIWIYVLIVVIVIVAAFIFFKKRKSTKNNASQAI